MTLIGVEDWVRIEIDGLEKHLQNSKEELLKAVNRNFFYSFYTFHHRIYIPTEMMHLGLRIECGKGKDEVQKEHETAYKEKTLHGSLEKGPMILEDVDHGIG